jgi:outer membrane receptor protein involved in Fe transport
VGHLFHAGRSARPVVRRPGMFFPGFTTALLLFVGCPCGAAAALDAESAPASEGGDQGGLQEVVVTAQFRRQNLQDTAIAITAVNAALLEQRNQTCGSRNLMDLRSVAEQV